MSTMSLAAAPRRTPLVITGVAPDSPIRRRMAELGLRPGAHVHVVQATAGGGVIVAVSGSRLAVDRHTAQHVEVSADGSAA